MSQLDIISRTLHVLEQRVSMNEECVQTCMSYFNDMRDSKAQSHLQNAMSTNIGHTSTQGNVINANVGGAMGTFNQNALNEAMGQGLKSDS